MATKLVARYKGSVLVLEQPSSRSSRRHITAAMNNNPKRRRPSARHNQTSSMKEDKKTKELIDNLIACFRSSTQSTVPFPTRPAPPPPSSQRKPLSDIAPTSFHDSRNEHVASRGTAKVGSKGSRAGTRLWRALQTSATRVIAQSVDFQSTHK